MCKDFQRCSYCGDLMFKEDIENNGKCKRCNKG